MELTRCHGAVIGTIHLNFTAKLIAGFEGSVGHVYADATGVPTIGFGETRRDLIDRYRDATSRPEALGRVQEFGDAVERCITNASALTPHRHLAFTSLAYNIGVGAFRDSTACMRFKAGDIDGVPEASGRWNKAGGSVLAGLTRRREAEIALFGDGPGRGVRCAQLAGTALGAGNRGSMICGRRSSGWPNADGGRSPTAASGREATASSVHTRARRRSPWTASSTGRRGGRCGPSRSRFDDVEAAPTAP